MAINMKVRGAAPALRISNWICRDCEHVWERKLTPQEQDAAARGEDNEMCSECGSIHVEEYVGTLAPPKVIVETNHDFSDRQRQRLYERSSAHFKKEGREEAIERQRAQFKREGMF